MILIALSVLSLYSKMLLIGAKSPPPKFLPIVMSSHTNASPQTSQMYNEINSFDAVPVNNSHQVQLARTRYRC